MGLFNAQIKEPEITGAFELKQIQFYVTLLSVFLNSAFNTASQTILSIASENDKQNIIQNIDLGNLQSSVLDLIVKIVNKEKFLPEDKFIVQNCLALWSGCIVYKPELFEDFK